MKKRFNIILAMDKCNGIGFNNKLPWNIPEDLQFFKKNTIQTTFLKKQNCVIMGSKTWQSCGILSNRYNIVISKQFQNLKIDNKDKIEFCGSIESGLEFANKEHSIDKIWVIGGSQIYEQCFRHHLLDKIYLTKIDDEFKCDRFITLPKLTTLSNEKFFTYVSTTKETKRTMVDYSINTVNFCEKQYLQLLEEIKIKGKTIKSRNGVVKSLLNKQLTFDLQDGFPLISTKKMFTKGIIEELLFFIRGDTNTKQLENNKIMIWKKNTDRDFLDGQKKFNYPDGEMGPMYGFQWRKFNQLYLPNLTNLDYLELSNQQLGIDQLSKVIEQIKENPHSRRIVMTDYNPLQVDLGVLYPCHSLIIQFFVRDEHLHITMYQRSADVFLGLPFNIASTSLLLEIISKLTNYKPGTVTINLGDCHIYENHFDAIETQLKRVPYKMPTITIPDFKTIDQVEKSVWKDYKINNYKCHRSIKANMVP